MSRLKAAAILTILIVQGGCATTSDVPNVALTSGAQIEVTQELRVQSGARLYIQNGIIRPRVEISSLQPFCEFYSDRPTSSLDEPLVIRPDVFTVTKSYRRRDYSWAANTEFAQIQPNANLSTIMELASDTQPEIERLTCIRWGSGGAEPYLTVDDMQTVLGRLVTLRPVK